MLPSVYTIQVGDSSRKYVGSSADTCMSWQQHLDRMTKRIHPFDEMNVKENPVVVKLDFPFGLSDTLTREDLFLRQQKLLTELTSDKAVNYEHIEVIDDILSLGTWSFRQVPIPVSKKEFECIRRQMSVLLLPEDEEFKLFRHPWSERPENVSEIDYTELYWSDLEQYLRNPSRYKKRMTRGLEAL